MIHCHGLEHLNQMVSLDTENNHINDIVFSSMLSRVESNNINHARKMYCCFFVRLENQREKRHIHHLWDLLYCIKRGKVQCKA